MKKLVYIFLAAATISAVGLVGYRVAKADIYGSSLVAWYTLDSNDISGTSVIDNSGQGNTGTTVNSPTQVPGVLGQALSFNGSSQYATVPNSSSLNTYSAISVSLWLKSPAGGMPVYGRIIEKGANSEWTITLNGNGTIDNKAWLQVFGSAARCIATAIPIADGTWHLLTMTAVANSAQLYVDGKLSNSSTSCGTPPGGTGNITIGAYSPGGSYYFNGSIDDVRIYSRALSANEVAQLYYNGRGSHGYSSF